MEVALVTLYACAIFSDVWTLTCDGSLEQYGHLEYIYRLVCGAWGQTWFLAEQLEIFAP
jgi:hypothetical protein